MTDARRAQAQSRSGHAARHNRRDDTMQRRRWLIAGAALAAIVLVLVVVEIAASAGRIHPGVDVGGVAVGGMSPAQAEAELASVLPARAATPVVVTYSDESWEIPAEQIGLSYDYERAADAAMSVGREGGLLGAAGARLRAWISGVDVPAVAVADEALMTETLAMVAESIDESPVDATVKIRDTKPEVVDGTDGRALDRPAAQRLVLAAFARELDRTIEAPVAVAPMAVDAAAAQKAADVAVRMLAEPVTVTYKKDSWEFPPSQIASWIRFTSPSSAEGEPASGVLEPVVSAKAAKRTIDKALGDGIGRPAKDASFKTSSGRVTVIPSQEGVGPDIAALAVSLTKELQDAEADRVVELRTKKTQPKITTEKARDMGIKERIATYTTTYESSNRPRVNNIHLLGDAIDGELIAPGDTFSFNEAAGERTAAKGYQEANAIVNGKLVPQLGGGVCQVGTTIFNTVFESGLPVVARRNHSFYISHYPKGRDATVSWGGPDFRFKNDTDAWVLVSVGYTDSSITISLYGTDPGYEVSAEVGEWTNVRPFPVKEVKDPTLAKGSKIVEDAGVSGRSITVKRVVTKGGKVVRTDSFASNYRPKEQVVKVGTKRVPAPSKTATESAAP